MADPVTTAVQELAQLDRALPGVQAKTQEVLAELGDILKHKQNPGVVPVHSDNLELRVKFHGLGVFFRCVHDLAQPVPQGYVEYGRWVTDTDGEVSYRVVGAWTVDRLGNVDGRFTTNEMGPQLFVAVNEVLGRERESGDRLPFDVAE